MNCGKSYIDEYGEAQGCGDFASQCPACLRAERDQLRAEVERLKAAPVVVPELTDVIEMLESSEKWEDHGESLREPLEKLRAISRLRTIGPGEVVVDAARLAALEAIAEKIERLALGPDGRAWTPLHYREFARGELRDALRSQKGGQP